MKHANQFDDFRPISLANTSYKVMQKVIANRMKPFLDKIISPNQTAFLKGKWIDENVVLAQEVLHTMNKTKSNKGWLGIKIDFSEGFY